ncbi:cbl-associated protein isoform X4 [Choristoneura fumiferana]|uniref:cbl-associated protein isoform X4 n=1 Tax=Choristoneura fumiferana TaxID=7141 RepID=UPI003D15B66B
MPDKSKRRKNNKNKRNKHKNKQDSNQISNVETSNTESFNASVDGDQEECEVNKQVDEYANLSLSNDVLVKNEDIRNKNSDTLQKCNQDLNCNSVDLPDLNTPVINNKMCDEVVIDSTVNNLQCTEPYVVESPEPSAKTKTKLNSNIKSKSLDNDDTTKIVEITDECNIQSDEENSSILVNVNNALVSDVDSDIEWEKTDEFQNAQTTIQDFIVNPLNTCDIPIRITHNDPSRTPLTPEEEECLRNCLEKLPLTSPSSDSSEIIIQTVQVINHGVKHRLRKKASADDFIFQRLGPPRTLDVIDEEGSGESSKSSRRQSYLSEKKNDVEDLDDEVFESAVKKEKYVTKMNKNAFGKQIQQQCVLVDTKIKDPEVTEARGDWSVTNTEKMFGAEVVYLTDTSSSTSSIYDNSEECDEGEETDVSVRMITPTIEVTDTETLLKESFVSNSEAVNDKTETLVNELPNQAIQNSEDVILPSSHEIVVLSTDNIKTNLTVKDVPSENESAECNNDDSNLQTSKNGEPPIAQRTGNEYDLEMKVLKCELNDAINNLIKEVSSDSESSEKNCKEVLNRQDSSSSVGSSQCTAKYNPTYSSLNDVANIVHDDMCDNSTNTQNTSQPNNTSHVKDVFECVTGITALSENEANNEPPSLKDLCVKKVATFPYGDKILEELASVSKQLQNITIYGHHSNRQEKLNDTYLEKAKQLQQTEKMPCYPLPDVSSIEKVSLPAKEKNHVPPPIQPRNSSLKISQDENHWVGIPTETEPVYVCFSPSQKMLMEKTNTVITKQEASQLVDMHKKYVDRRGYNENNDKEQRKENQRPDKTPVIPFKSQTGSRLLALIRDPAVTENITSMKTRNQLQIIDEVQHIDKTSHKKYNTHTHFGSVQEFSSNFRPIPPPRTRKFSSSVYESDESSDFTDSSFRSIKNERKIFHFSTGNLSKEIENDISSIQNMHRYYTDVRDNLKDQKSPRRPSLPKDLCDQQMEYIRRKEKEVEAEIHRLENEKLNIPEPQMQGPRAPLYSESKMWDEKITRTSHHSMLLQKDSDLKISGPKLPKASENKGKLSVFSRSQEELLRDKMYSEYVSQMAEREERRQQKVIKITNNTNSKPISIPDDISKSMPSLDFLDSKVNNRIEKEFIWKARQRWNKLGIKDPETEDEKEETNKDVYKEPKVIEHKIKVIEGGEERDVKKLPSHLQEFVRFTVKDSDKGKSSPETVMIAPRFKARSTSPAVWRAGAPTPPPAPAPVARSPGAPPPPPPPPVWTPGSAGASPQTPRKTFRPVHFEETPPSRRKFGSSDQNGCTSGSESEGRLRTSHSAPATGLNSLGGSSRLPRAQNPTVTLLQKARENQLSRGPNYLQQERDSARLPRDRASPPKGDPVHALRREYASEGEAERSEYNRTGPRKMAHAHEKVEGIGPTTKDGMPVALRSEVKDQSKWYKKMYDTIHKNKYDDDYVTIRYKSRRGQQPQRVMSNKSQYAYFDPRSGYLSEPEGGLSRLGSSTWSDAYDSDVNSSPRRRTTSVQEERRFDDATSPYMPSNKYSTLASARASHEVYKNQPGRIENYVPGRSSVVDKEAKQWWDEVMDIFDGWLDDNSPLPPYTTLLARAIQKSQISSTTSLHQASPKEKKDITSAILSKSNMARALKESGYESDSTLVFRRRDDTEAPLSPAERRAAYKDLQAGGEPPLRGFRSPAPPRTDESEIEYIPISPTLTKIRVHKKSPQIHEVICYPVTGIEHDDTKFKKKRPSFISVDVPTRIANYPPAPPRRVSSRNSRTLRLVTSTAPVTSSTPIQSQSNVDYLRNKISHKLTRQNTHIISKPEPDNKPPTDKTAKSRAMSTSAPPALNRKSNAVHAAKSFPKKSASEIKAVGTSSFGSPRKTLLPTEYAKPLDSRYSDTTSSVIIEGGAGRRTPISNILDKVTPIDKLWSSEKRNERIEISKIKPKTIAKTNMNSSRLSPVKSTSTLSYPKSSLNMNSHKSRDMMRTAEKVQKYKLSNQAKSSPCLNTKIDTSKPSKPLQVSSVSKLSTSSNNQIKTASVTNLKKKKSLESLVIRPRSVPCHESCSKKSKDASKPVKKPTKTKSTKKGTTKYSDDYDSASQFGDTSNDVSNFGSFEDLRKTKISSKDIKQTRDAIQQSDSFFQHLFLGTTHVPTITQTSADEKSSVLQKAKMFQSFPQDNYSAKSLNSYLIHRKPVSLSRFKMWDRYPSPVRIQSPRSISWPGRMYQEVRKFDSLSKYDEFGSNSSLATVRSRSEPPTNKLFFSQTSRPISPTVIFHKVQKPAKPETSKKTLSPSRLVFSQTSRPVSPIITRKVTKVQNEQGPEIKRQSLSPSKMIFTETVRPISPVIKHQSSKLTLIEPKVEDKLQPSTIFFSQTSRPVSPKVQKKKSSSASGSRSQSTSPVSFRSPSYRRIHNARIQSSKHVEEFETKKLIRTRSADDAKQRKPISCEITKTKSNPNIPIEDPDYDEYIRDMENSKARSERFRELNRYYSYLERVGELEKATSTSDLRHRRKDEEIIDFDRWKKIRAIERAEEELNNLYHKLKTAQTENDVLFYPRDLKDFRWNYDSDRGLRIKEKSVEDLKEQFQQENEFDSLDLEQSKDIYKPLWRGTSVAETAFNINRKDEIKKKNDSSPHIRPTIMLQDTSITELRKKIGLGNRLWSSLSMEQVNALKNQLNAIYSKELESKSAKENDKYYVEVKDTNEIRNSNLHVRSNSLNSTCCSPIKEHELNKSESIAAIACSVPSVKDLKNNVNKIQMSLSENEKRKMSQTLSKEIMNRINKLDADPVLNIQEISIVTPPPLPVEQKENQLVPSSVASDVNDESKKYESISSKTKTLQPESIEAMHQSSASETETGSSDVSNRTVIYREPSKDVKQKVEYFESVKNVAEQTKTVYHARDSSDEKENADKNLSHKQTPEKQQEELKKAQIFQSQSCTNFKELFGESEKSKFLSLPPKHEICSRSSSPQSEVHATGRRTPDTLPFSSDETIWRSRSPSPDPERYWRAYLNLARAGEVRRLARRFDSPSAAGAVLRRHRSDPELSRNIIHQNYDNPRRDKHRGLPVARVPLRPANRYMPHIDIISKLASLRKRATPRSRSAEEALECRPGEVNRIRRRFETMSLLGQIYASAPDMSELRDIAPYLAGPWVAHRYPMRSDNNRSLKETSTLVEGRKSPVKKVVKNVAKDPVKLSSILKSDVFAKQEFNASAHRPTSRYEPPRTPPRPPPASWPYRLAPYVTPSRHTVTFQETDAPEPPRRATFRSNSDTESPRRYVESDVNIHYRCPVRQDPLPLVPERELARQQAEHMKRLYREQRRHKYLQELQDMQNRRHQDNFTPSQKTVVPLNRYDEAERIAARAIYAFNGQTPRELSFKKGDLIQVRRQIDSNWYEGELHGRIGLFPYNYVEILKGDVAQSPKKPVVQDGRARAKFDFTAQTNLELPLKKGEVVVLTRRIDQNWWEGRNGTKTGIFPDSYVTVLQEPSQSKPEVQPNQSEKPVASPAAHGLLNGAAKRSMGAHSYLPQPNNPALANAPPATQPLPGYTTKPAQAAMTPSERGYGPPTGKGVDLNNSEPLYVDTNAEAVPYRAMYKYRPQNPDELELNEGDTVYVLEKCDDGWYVGSSQRTGRFGTFPGNYVERI